MLSRRAFLLASGATGLSACAGVAPPLIPPGAPSTPTDASRLGDAQGLNGLLDRIFQEQLDDSPETATSLGLDTGARAEARGRLDDRSAAAADRYEQDLRRWLGELRAVDRGALSGLPAVNLDTVASQYAVIDAANARFDFGARGYPSPYVVSQLTGAYQSVPDFLASQHPLATTADAEAYLSRLEAFGGVLNQETERLRADAARGVVPPDFVLAKALEQLRAIRRGPAAGSVLVTSVVDRARQRQLPGDWSARAVRLVEGPIAAALDAQIAAVTALQPRATHDAGVWRLPQGADYYAFGLRYHTTTDRTADDIHQLGLDQVAEITARIDTILRGQGMSQGSVGRRIRALGDEKRFIYPNTEAGKAQLLSDLNAQIVALDRRLPEVFGTLPKAKVEVKRVPTYIEAGAPGGYYQTPTLDGSRPGAYYINLRDTAEWPKWSLPTLTYHEATPGHHLQSVLALEAEGLPLLRRNMWFAAYGEGWALYAEQLADELGMYRDDPFGRVGYLQSLLFRAARLVVDTGLHHKRWSREQAIRWMTDATGDQESAITTEVERYCVWPGQATSYKVGHTEWVRLREDAKRRLGARFDIRRFHDAALLSGAMPLNVLERVVNDWVVSQGA